LLLFDMVSPAGKEKPMHHVFEQPLVAATFVKRYKRFFVDATLPDGTTAIAHCANTGSMAGLAVPGAPVWLLPVTDPNRSLKYGLELIDAGTSLVGVNTRLPNALAAAAIADGTIAELANPRQIQREKAYGENSRIDLLLTDRDGRRCFVEVKNVTMANGTTALFPDAVTTRGEKHLHELMAQVKAGDRAVMLFLAQRSDCVRFAPADAIDPTYAATLRQAADAGVELLCYGCTVTPAGIRVAQPLPIDLNAR
jgi:sugar fermentation stimulation protein A